MISHDFFRSPILKSLPLSALHTPPITDEPAPELADIPSATSSELRKTVIRVDSTSVSESSSKQSGKYLLYNCR